MRNPALCIDTDALINFLALDCLPEAVACFGCQLSDCLRLPAAPHQILRRASIAERWPILDRVAVSQKASQIAVVPTPIALEIQDELNQIDGIDLGEALLLAATYEDQRRILVTGDLRMLRALHVAQGDCVKTVREALQGRVAMFPQLIGEVARRLSVRELEVRMRAAYCRHSTLRVLFGTRRPTRESDFWQAYESEMRTFREICGDWLYSFLR